MSERDQEIYAGIVREESMQARICELEQQLAEARAELEAEKGWETADIRFSIQAPLADKLPYEWRLQKRPLSSGQLRRAFDGQPVD